MEMKKFNYNLKVSLLFEYSVVIHKFNNKVGIIIVIKLAMWGSIFPQKIRAKTTFHFVDVKDNILLYIQKSFLTNYRE